MSGFAFQKLNGGATTANKQLGELKAINQDLDEVIGELKEVNQDLDEVIGYLQAVLEASARPDIWRLARMFHPDAVLTPVQWSWHMFGGAPAGVPGR